MGENKNKTVPATTAPGTTTPATEGRERRKKKPITRPGYANRDVSLEAAGKEEREPEREPEKNERNEKEEEHFLIKIKEEEEHHHLYMLF